MSDSELSDALASGRYAFLDLGSGVGGSIEHCARRFARGAGIGIEVDRADRETARRAGLDVIEADVRSVTPPERSVGFVSMMDFLEHLPDLASSNAVLERFARAARDFVFVRHPSFEDTDYLAGLGLKIVWTDWAEHPNMFRLADYRDLFARLGWTDYAIFPRDPIVDSESDRVVPISAPRDLFFYEPAHGAKPYVRFDRPVFTQFDIFVRFGGTASDEAWAAILATDSQDDSPLWPAEIHTPRGATPVGDEGLAIELGFYDSETSRWRVRAADGSEREITYGAGGRGWRAFVGDFDGDGAAGIGGYDPATGDFFMRHTVAEGDADVATRFGAPGGYPVAGDWTGSGTDTFGVYMPSTGDWFLRHANESGPADEQFSFGPAGTSWLPVVGDWDGDGRDSAGLYDPATAGWHLRGAGPDGGDLSFTFGPPGCLPVAGDWNGDGRDSIGVYAPDWGLWILRDTNANGPADRVVAYRADGTPIAGRFGGR